MNSAPAAPPSRTAALIDALARSRGDVAALEAQQWTHAVADEVQAYAVQDGVARALGWVGPGHQVARHWKSGAPSRSGPFGHAPLDPAHVGPDRAGLTPLPWPVLGFEAEVALRLARPVTPAQAHAMQPGQAGDWVDAMCVAVELVASRWAEGLAAPDLLRLADHQSHAGLLLGPWRPWRALDWAGLGLRVRQQDLAPLDRRGGHSLDDPAWLLPAWLQHLSRHGDTVPAGTMVTTGAWGGLLPLSKASREGAEIEVEFEEIGRLEFSL